MAPLQPLRFLQDDAGATAIEYGLITGLIAVVVIAGMIVLGTALDNIFAYWSTAVTNAVSSSS